MTTQSKPMSEYKHFELFYCGLSGTIDGRHTKDAVGLHRCQDDMYIDVVETQALTDLQKQLVKMEKSVKEYAVEYSREYILKLVTERDQLQHQIAELLNACEIMQKAAADNNGGLKMFDEIIAKHRSNNE